MGFQWIPALGDQFLSPFLQVELELDVNVLFNLAWSKRDPEVSSRAVITDHDIRSVLSGEQG